MIVRENKSTLSGQGPEPRIDLGNAGTWIDARTPGKTARRSDAAKNHAHVEGTRQRDHRDDVVLVVRERRRSCVTGEIVSSAQQVDYGGLQLNDIGHEAQQDLGAG